MIVGNPTHSHIPHYSISHILSRWAQKIHSQRQCVDEVSHIVFLMNRIWYRVRDFLPFIISYYFTLFHHIEKLPGKKIRRKKWVYMQRRLYSQASLVIFSELKLTCTLPVQLSFCWKKAIAISLISFIGIIEIFKTHEAMLDFMFALMHMLLNISTF